MPLLKRRSALLAVAAAIVVSVAMSSALSPPNASPVSAADPFVSIDPSSANAALDGTVDVDILINGATSLYSASAHVAFDPAHLEVVDSDPGRAGAQIIPGRFPGPSQGPSDVTVNSADNTAGTVEYDVTLLPDAPAVAGSGVMATIRFHALAAGASAVTVESATLWDSQGAGITTGDPVSGEVVVEDAATDTPAPIDTPAATATGQATATRTPTATHATNTPAATRTAKPTNTPKPTKTPKDTATPKPPKSNAQTATPAGGVAGAGAQPTASNSLPSAGSGDMASQMWRWFFLSGALVLGLATWAFTFRFYARQKENERFWHR
jgi:Cohesin domain